MSKASLKGILNYENRWIRFTELGPERDEHILLCKEIKDDFINPNESWIREKKISEQLGTVEYLKSFQDSKKLAENKKVYLLPKGDSLYAHIEKDNLEMSERIKVADELIRITLELHSKNYLFCDLNPRLFWYDQIDELIYLVDAIMTVDTKKLSEQYSTVIGIEPDMLCMPPEHTMNANANLDFRSNYYSLGVILYTLFTGSFPFQGFERVAITYKHLSQLPNNPKKRNPELSASMAAFIMKLLAKDPNDRYQSPPGLLHDFRIAVRLQSEGDLELLPEFGTRDFPSIFNVPRSVFLRRESNELLKDLSQYTSNGNKALAVIFAEHGGGTSYLLDSFFEDINYDRHYIGSGKLEAENSIPFKGLKDVTTEILQQLLMEDPEDIRNLRHLLNKEIGNLSGVLIDFNNDFNHLFDAISEVKDLIGNAAINRFIYAFTEFLRILELQGKTIILSLEHFERVDMGTSMLFSQLLKSSAMQSICVILGFAKNESEHNIYCKQFLEKAKSDLGSEDHTRIEHIELENYDKQQVIDILDTLKLEPKQDFGEILYSKTGGNPSFINQFLQELSTHKYIRANSELMVWEVNMSEIRNIHVSENLNEFLMERITQLPAEKQEVLKAAACIGQEMDVTKLMNLIPFENSTAGTLIDSLREYGFFSPVEYHNARLVRIKFSHSGFVSVLQDSMTHKELQNYKLSILESLVNAVEVNLADSRTYEIASHLLPLNAKNCLPYLSFIEKAAYKAKKETAFSSAETYFSKLCDIDKISPNAIQEKVFENLYQAAICSLHAMDYNRYKNLFIELQDNVSTEIQSCRIFLLRAIESIQREDYYLTLDILEEGLNEMGVQFSQSITKSKIIKLFMLNLWRTRVWDESSVVNIPEDTSEIRQIYHRLINISAPAVYFLKPQLTSLINYIGIKNTFINGWTTQTPYHFIGFAFQINSFSNSVSKAHKMSQLAYRLIEKGVASEEEVIPVDFLYNSFVRHSAQPLDACIISLEENYKKGREQGNISLAHYSLGMNRWYLLFNGVPLSHLHELLNASHRLSIEENQGLIDDFHKLIKTLVIELERGHFTENAISHPNLPVTWEAIKGDRYKNNRILLSNLIMIRMIVDAGNNRIITDSSLIKTLLDSVKEGGHGPYNTVLHIFYSCFHYFRGNRISNGLKEREIDKFIKVLQVRAKTAPSNYKVKYLLILGMKAEYKGKLQEAKSFYNEAYLESHQYSNLWDKALAAELYGIHLKDIKLEKASINVLKEAANYYKDWGAVSISNRIFSEYPELVKNQTNSVQNMDHDKSEIVSSYSINELLNWSLKVFHLDNPDAQVGALLDKILEEAIAERAIYVINDQSGYLIYAHKDHGIETKVINSIANNTSLPLTVFRLVDRRKKFLTIGDARNDPQFRTDPYVGEHNVRSILCIPFVRGKETRSFIYLENNHLDGIFDDVNLDLISWIFSQIAISIDSAVLTDTLEEKLEQRSEQIKKERDKANELITNILPKKVAEELKTYGRVKAQKFDNVSVLFTDFKDFSIFSESLNAEQIINELDECFREFDRIIEKYGLEKIKTIGDSYMCAGGIPESYDLHEYQITRAGLEMLAFMEASNQDRIQRGITPLALRVGIHSGPLIAGIVGSIKYAYDIWGPTVNIASRMESSGIPGRLNVSGSMYLRISDKFKCTYRGKISAKNIGEVDMYLVDAPL